MLKDSKLKNGDNFILAIPLDKITELIKQVTQSSGVPVCYSNSRILIISSLSQANELNLVTEYNKYLITNLVSYFIHRYSINP